ncbi:MAG: hypothetical protein AAF234_02820 [Pseudomonadota bacterium]
MANPHFIVDFELWAKEKRPMLAHDRLKETETKGGNRVTQVARNPDGSAVGTQSGLAHFCDDAQYLHQHRTVGQGLFSYFQDYFLILMASSRLNI